VGVKPAAVAGELREVVRNRYAPVLELLGSTDLLSSGRERVIAWAKDRGVAWTGKVVDSRYPFESIAQLIALRHEAFWFVLFAFPDHRGFTRLVVVPIEPRAQNFDLKAPAQAHGGGAADAGTR
jgi:hypothetical protein